LTITVSFKSQLNVLGFHWNTLNESQCTCPPAAQRLTCNVPFESKHVHPSAEAETGLAVANVGISNAAITNIIARIPIYADFLTIFLL
jgi:hypothetical protein